MFFILSKTLGVMLLPTNFLIGLGLVGVALSFTRLVGFGRSLMIASIVMLAVAGFSPFGSWLLYPLESRFPPWDATQGAPDGIVVLGGAIESDPSAARGTAVYTGSASRIVAAAALAHRYPGARILYTGGNPNLVSDDAAREADYAVAVFESLGIPRDRLIVERRSRNTYENAVFSKPLASPKSGERWLLVTSAYHMPRAVGIFQKVGFPVEACPADWRLAGTADLLTFWTQAVEGLQHTDIALREWMGLAAYRISGKTDEFFPGPDGK